MVHLDHQSRRDYGVRMTSQQAFAVAVADSRSRATARPHHVSTASVMVNGRTVYAVTYVNGVAVATKGGR